jgi:receptor-type tyrosine-protein phosphatase R
VFHYWYTAWPDHNLPENPNALIQLIKQVESYRKFEEKSPILVHCSAGVGRTGCFLALAIGIKQIDTENLVDIVQIVCQLRVERGGMIQTLEQYEFIYQVLSYYCLYYKKIPLMSTSSSISTSVSSPSSICLKSPTSTSSSFSFNTQTIH